MFVLLGLFAVGKTQGMLFLVQWLQGWRLSQRTLRLWHIKQLLTDDMAENLRYEPLGEPAVGVGDPESMMKLESETQACIRSGAS